MIRLRETTVTQCSVSFYRLFLIEVVMTQVRRITLALFAIMPVAFTSLPAKAQDIDDTAVAAGNFSTLVAAVQAAGLVDVLKGEGPFTVFAPTDEAFAALPEGTLENLLKPENKDQLVAVLTYHVVPGKIMSTDIAGQSTEVESVQGSALSVDATDGVRVDNANVVAADIETGNGVIHVIDQVVIPQQAVLLAGRPPGLFP